MNKIDPLESTRLILRDYESSDSSWVHSYGSDDVVVRFMEWGPNSIEDTREFVERVLKQQQETPRKDYSLAVELKGEGPIGTMALFNISNEHNGEAEIGYVFNRQYWGRGFATEAAKAAMDFGFNRLGLHKIYAKCVTEHRRSASVIPALIL